MSYHTECHKTENRLPVAQQRPQWTAPVSALSPVRYGRVLRQVLGLCSRMRFRKAAALTLRLTANPLLSLRWFRFLNDFAIRYQLSQPHDDLMRKAIPNFFHYRASPRERLNLLQNHFILAGQVMAVDDLHQLWKGGQINCATVQGKRETYEILLHLSDHAGARHEGAFTISLSRCRDQALLCMLSFIFVSGHDASHESCVTVAIGGLQGASGDGAKRAMIDATRDLHGLRPKDAMLLIAEGIARERGAEHFLAVGNANHVINFRSNMRRRRMVSDLDRYWIERGGQPCTRFGFALQLRNQEFPQEATQRDLCKSAFLLTGKRMVIAVRAAVT
ncbi:DUF535 family protein [Pseudochrobactrum sp. sp1633]|uniref:DUF535 family protein n=1 Tax=Pseudochrobactrum sp. sp1633 TaxID=3036706 RepID=UPI0025A61874|nr:DUF535 family protein [Pseudochrobactrum sp. sp1633]MDM8344464.1 DUF535 family protein [Pseudochrobactrum sp. sp1633]HWD14404.1 DUF535 family protein [Pseudochrobactrum sp.]